jgi:hypothetical protein
MGLRRSRRWIWAARVVFALIVLGLAGYLWRVGLDEADKLASGISSVLALLALGAPYLLPRPDPAARGDSVDAAGTGAVALAGDNAGEISTDVSGTGHDAGPPAQPGSVSARGTGSVAIGGNNTAPVRTSVRGRRRPPGSP